MERPATSQPASPASGEEITPTLLKAIGYVSAVGMQANAIAIDGTHMRGVSITLLAEVPQ